MINSQAIYQGSTNLVDSVAAGILIGGVGKQDGSFSRCGAKSASLAAQFGLAGLGGNVASPYVR